MALVQQRPVRHLSGRYISYTKDLNEMAGSTGELSGYITTPFQYGFLIRPASINNQGSFSFDTTTPQTTPVLKIAENRFSGAIVHMVSFSPAPRLIFSGGLKSLYRGCRLRNAVFRFYDQETLNPNFQGSNVALLNKEYDAEYSQVYVQPPVLGQGPGGIDINPAYPYNGIDPILNTIDISVVLEDAGTTIVFQVTHYRPDQVKGHITLF